MADADHVRLGRIAEKLATARAWPARPEAFGARQHGFKLGDPLPEAVVADFEERHEVALPAAYRLFVVELGDGGAGPGYHLSQLSEACHPGCGPGHLARPSPARTCPGRGTPKTGSSGTRHRRDRAGRSCRAR